MAAELRIPVENVFYLLCYAWNSLPQAGLIDVNGLRGRRISDLLGSVLVTGLNRLLRQGLERQYVGYRQELATLRGRIQISDTVKRGSLLRGKAVCSYSELDPDTQANRILRSTIRSLVLDRDLDPETRGNLSRLLRGLQGIEDQRITRHHFGRVQFHRNNRLYRFLISICRLWLERSFVDETTGQTRFRDFVRDERQMRMLFQAFVFNFFRHHLREAHVSAMRLDWSVPDEFVEEKQLLPALQTDICVRRNNELMIIDTKFTGSLRTYRGTAKLRESHLFQIHAYMANMARSSRAQGASISGMLLYPATSAMADLHLRLTEFPFHVCHLNLAQPWEAIEARLTGLLEAALPPTGAESRLS